MNYFPASVLLVLDILILVTSVPMENGIRTPDRGSKIIGGEDALPEEFPFIVSLKTIDGKHFCGGFIVSNQHILSAAHCFREVSTSSLKFVNGQVDLSSFQVTLGEHNLKESEEPIDAINVAVVKLTLNEEYKQSNKENDLAILQLDRDISAHSGAVAVNLPEKEIESQYTGKKVTAAGWGLTDPFDTVEHWEKAVNILKKVEITVWDSAECRKAYVDYKFPTKSFICAGDKGRESCKGDSGGPLLIRKDTQWTAIGVTSVGAACGTMGHPGVYTDVSRFLKWIKANTVTTKHHF